MRLSSIEAESFFLPGRKQKEGRRSVPSTIVTGLYGHLDRQWQFNYISNGGAQQWHKVCRDAKRHMQTVTRAEALCWPKL